MLTAFKKHGCWKRKIPIMKPLEIVHKMFSDDTYSQWLGIEIIEAHENHCVLTMKVRAEMLNGFKIAHGGITYALADSALAFASNGAGRYAVSIHTSIDHHLPVSEGDFLTATVKPINVGHKVAHYEVNISRDTDHVASFRGMVYRRSQEWKQD